MKKKMLVIGLTGSIGMGKSTAANMLRDMGIPVHDSDACVHQLLGPHGAGVKPVFAEFSDAYDKNTDSIDRSRLRALLGKDHAQWDRLERILHPLVQQSQQDFIREKRNLGVKIVALDIPLLFETGAEKRVDATICVSCPAVIQRQRVLSPTPPRRPISEEDFAFRLSRQMSDEEKRRRADFTVQTGIGLAETRRELETIINKLNDRRPKNENGRLPPHQS